MANVISYDDYKKLLAAGQKYVTAAQAADPEWVEWDRIARSLPFDEVAPASPDKDYWAEYMSTLTPEQQLGFQQNAADAESWTDKITPIMSLIPYAVGGIGLAGAAGLLGASAEAAALPAFDTGVGGLFGSQAAIDSALASAGGGVAAPSLAGAAAPAATAAASTPLWNAGGDGLFGSQQAIDTALNSAGWYPSASIEGGVNQGGLLLGDLLPPAYQSILKTAAPGLLDQILDKAPDLLKAGGSLLGGGGSAGGGTSPGGSAGARSGNGYTPPGLLPPRAFKAPSGLAELTRNMMRPAPARMPRWGLLGD
jgi:hypothetical protein